MLVNSVLSPCNPYVDQWFAYASDYQELKLRLLKGEFKTLPDQDQRFLLAFINKKEWVFRAFTCGDILFFKALVEAGADLNALDADGKSILALVQTPDMFLWLYEKGAEFHSSEISMLRFLLKKSVDVSEGKQSDWKEVLLIVAVDIATEDFYAIDGNDMDSNHWENFFILIQQDGNVQAALREVIARIIEEKTDGILLIARNFLAKPSGKLFREVLIKLIDAKCIPDFVVEQIATDVEILFWNLRESEWLGNLFTRCPALAGDMAASLRSNVDPLVCVYSKVVLKTDTLSQTAKLFVHLRDLPDVEVWDRTTKKCLHDHVVKLQIKEKNTIWMAMATCYDEEKFHLYGMMPDGVCSSRELLQVKKLGFDPNLAHPVHRQTLLFTNAVLYLDGEALRDIGFDIHHSDINNNNALEYNCRKLTRFSLKIIDILVLSEAKLTDRFPNVEQCRSTFPGDNNLQALLSVVLLNPDQSTIRLIAEHMSDECRKTWRKAFCKDPVLKDIFREPIAKKNSHPIVAGDGKRRYHPESVPRSKIDLPVSRKENPLVFLTSFWDTVIPKNICDMIPESPLASLVLGALQRQHQELIAQKRKEPVNIEKFFSALQHDDMVRINHYFFAHPEFMCMLVQDYMHAKVIRIQPGGGSITNYADTVFALMTQMGDLLQLPRRSCNVQHKTLLKAFNAQIIPVGMETLKIADDANVRLLGRTVVVTRGKVCDAFKFLKPGEKYDYFAQEHSVCKALRMLAADFKSQIIEPIGVYAVRQLPLAFHPYQNKLGGLNNKFVFHYKTLPATYEYLQDVPAEKYREARSTTLHDAATLIRLGIYPDLAAMFHNHRQSRRYVLLVDVMARLIHTESAVVFNPAGGGGRLEMPFVKTKYPNARLTGITDWRDALLYYDEDDTVTDRIQDMHGLEKKEKGTIKYFYQMNALSSVLLIDMLILAERHMNEGSLQWQNQALIEQFGRELAEGFACLFASYAKQDYTQSLRFAFACGIDWTRAARQIAFWLDTGHEGYPAYVARGEVPPGLYEDHIQVKVNMTGAENFDGRNGFSTNGSQDIGVYNGPLALDQFEKAAHLLFNAVALAEPLGHHPRGSQRFRYRET